MDAPAARPPRPPGASGGRVSIVIPAFNAARYLPESLESAFAQTYGDIEVIVVDDGSTDDTQEVLAGYPAARVVTKKNGGLSSALNAGIDAMTGVWFKKLDADDVLYPNCVEDLIRANARFDPSDRTIPTMAIRIKYPDGSEWLASYDCSGMDTFEQGVRHLDHYIGGAAESIFHRSVFERVGKYDEKIRLAEDYEFNLRLLVLNKYRFFHVPIPVYEYRIRDSSLSSVSVEERCAAMSSILGSTLAQLGPGERRRYAAALKKFRSNRAFIRGVYDFVNAPRVPPPPRSSYGSAARAGAARLLRSSRRLHALYRGALSARRARSARYLAGWMWAGCRPDGGLAARCRGLHPNKINEVTPL